LISYEYKNKSANKGAQLNLGTVEYEHCVLEKKNLSMFKAFKLWLRLPDIFAQKNKINY
jgi:hypothetical protein